MLLPLLFITGFASMPSDTCTLDSGVPVQWKPGCCEDPTGFRDADAIVKYPNSTGSCATKDNHIGTTDPRVFGPSLWRAFHLIAANFPSPPTDAAHQACVNFVMALPYLVPCRHCGWDLGEFIKRNIQNDTFPTLGASASRKKRRTSQSLVNRRSAHARRRTT